MGLTRRGRERGPSAQPKSPKAGPAPSLTGPYGSQEEILDYIDETAPYLGGLSDAHTRLNLSPEMFRWKFRELPVSKLLHLKSDWRRWYESEQRERRDEDGDDNYFDGLEQEWQDGQVGPIIVVIIDGELDIGDGWHRAAIAVTQGWKTVPAVVGSQANSRVREAYRSAPGEPREEDPCYRVLTIDVNGVATALFDLDNKDDAIDEAKRRTGDFSHVRVIDTCDDELVWDSQGRVDGSWWHAWFF